MEIHAKLKWNKSTQQLLKKLNLESGGAAQYALDSAIVKDCAKYCPKDSGTLADSARGIGTGLIVYPGPYAHYMYYGKLYLAENGSSWAKFGETKHATGISLNYSKEKNELAGPFWFERAKADRKEAWLKAAKGAVGGK